MNKNDNRLNETTIKDINICRQIIFMSDNLVDNRIAMFSSNYKKHRWKIIISLPYELVS
jgi:hypothetical protein